MYVGIDIGGSNVRIARFSGVENPTLEKKLSLSVGNDFDTFFPQLIEQIRKCIDGQKTKGIGVALPGIVNSVEGYIESSVNLPGWDKKPIKAKLIEAFNVPVKAEQDTAAGALGEALYGAGKNKEKFAFIIWGTGFGGTVVQRINDQIILTQLEIGHQILDWNGPKCPCGQNGCFEFYIGGGSLTKIHGVNLSGVKDEKMWNELAEKATHALINMHMFHPTELIVYSGGLISKQPQLLQAINTLFLERQRIYSQPVHVLSQLGEDAGLFGALGLFR